MEDVGAPNATGPAGAPRAGGGASRRSALIAAAAVVVAGAGFFAISTLGGLGTADSGLAGRGGVSYRVPEQVRSAPRDVREAYEFAIARPDVLEFIPCPCGCVLEGHQHNRACFVAAYNPDGTVALDQHGFT